MSPRTPQIAFDVSAIALGWGNERARTGIFRFSKELVQALARQSVPKENGQNKGYTLSLVSGVPDVTLGDYEHYMRFAQSFKDDTPDLETIPLLESRNQNRELDCEKLDCNVYHSPFYAVPDLLRKQKGLKVFQTVSDVFPLLFPALCSEEVLHVFPQIIKSITPDDWIICVSEYTKTTLACFANVDPDKLAVVYHAADPNLFHPVYDKKTIETVLSKYGLLDQPYFLSIGAFDRRKNLPRLIRCFARLVQQLKNKDLRLVLIGPEGGDSERVLAACRENRLEREQIILTGFVPDADLAALYSGALAFVYPSHFEGFGLPALEAMQCGTPVVTSNSSSLPEVVGRAAILVEPWHEDAICSAMEKLYNDSELRSELSKKGLVQAQRFSWDNSANSLLSAYKRALVG